MSDDAKEPSCARSWEVEAVRDGRLLAANESAAVRHLGECAECRKLSGDFDRLGLLLREVEVSPDSDVAVRRLRQRILAQADAELTGRSRPSHARTRKISLIAAFFMILAGSFAAFRLLPSPTLAHRPQTTAATVDALAEGNTHWSRQTETDVERIDLDDGTLRLRVQRTQSSKRVIVRVPDGEIEDVGTVFYVVVAHGATQAVGVDEGEVVIRLKGANPLVVTAGHRWQRPSDSVTVPVESLKSSAMPLGKGADPEPTLASRSTTNPGTSDSVSSRTERANAEREDRAYLHAIRLLREGKHTEAKAAAKEYLRSFPDGFRREEIGQVLQY